MNRLLFLPILAIILLGCKGDRDNFESAESYNKLAVVENYAGSQNYLADTSAAISLPSKANPVGQKIIREANLRYPTDDLQKTYSQISLSIKKHNGEVQNDSEGNGDDAVYKNIVVRIPSENFDAFLADISNGVRYFDNKEITSRDITEEYIDVGSRIKTKKTLETRYLELLKKANKVSEMLEVEKQLSGIREEIESKQARLEFLKTRVAMSTFNIYFYRTNERESGATVSYGAKIGNALKSGINSLSNFLIWLLEVWPFILILVVLIFFFRKRFLKRKKL